MCKAILVFISLLFAAPAMAAELTLNDLPSVLQKLRGCEERKGTFSTMTVCTIAPGDLWASVDSAGALTLFSKRSYGDTTYASGKDVSAVLRDFASKLNQEQGKNKMMLEAIGQYLPTQ